MNDLIRPALYNARHSIVPSKKNNTNYKKNIEFVGPICETSDKFLNVKKYQHIKEKDFLLILDVGAYGMSLASNYCFRPKPAEILISKSNIKVIRKKEKINKLIMNN
jgi:diaminopimelate decarboxylase